MAKVPTPVETAKLLKYYETNKAWPLYKRSY